MPKISELTLLAKEVVATDDEVAIVDKSAGVDGSKKLKLKEFVDYQISNNKDGKAKVSSQGDFKYLEDAIHSDDGSIAFDNDGDELDISIPPNSIGATAIDVSGNGTVGQVLASDALGGFTWAENSGGTGTSVYSGFYLDRKICT